MVTKSPTRLLAAALWGIFGGLLLIIGACCWMLYHLDTLAWAWM